MTISTTYAPVQYTGNAVTTAFSFPYPFFDNTDLLVYLNGVLQVSGYTVTGGSGSSGTVTFLSAPASGVIVTLAMSLPYTQLDNYVENQAFPADTLERGLDKAAIRDQQLSNAITRSLRYPDSVSGITTATLPTPVNNSALLFDGTTGKIKASADYITDAIATATAGVTGTALVTATSTTSLATTGTGSKLWTIQSGRGFALGQRLRVASDDGTKINEGIVTSYSGTSLTINVDYVSGTGTHADWNISVTGDRGATGGGTGDMLAANNLSELTSKPTAFNTIKQAATDTNSGVVELATDAEMITGTDTTRAATPANVQAKLSNVFSGCSLYQTAGTVLTITTWVTLLFDTEAYDDSGWHSTSVNTGRITVDFTGRVSLIGTVNFGAAGNAVYGVRLLKNGAVIKNGDNNNGTGGIANVCRQVYDEVACVPTDYFELQAYTNNASPTSGTGIENTSFKAKRIR